MRSNKTCSGLKYAAGIGLWCFALTGSVQAAQTSMYMTGTFPNGFLGNDYVGPYEAIIGGAGPVPVICDDLADDTWIGESWTANVINSANLSSSLNLTRFGSQANAVQTYEEAAWLGLQLLNAPAQCGAINTACAGDYQYAIWALFDPTAFPIQTSGLGTTDQALASSILSSVTGNPTGHLYNNFTLYSYVPGTDSCPGPCITGPQEFMVVHTPEPSQAAILALDFSGLGALLLVYRRFRKQA